MSGKLKKPMFDNEHDRLVSTKEGRDQCVAEIKRIASLYPGAAVQLHEFTGPREIGLDLTYGPFFCAMYFDGSDHAGAFIGHWYMNRARDDESAKTYPDTFWRVGSFNTFHKQKATTIENTFAGFLAKLEEGLELLSAYT